VGQKRDHLQEFVTTLYDDKDRQNVQ